MNQPSNQPVTTSGLTCHVTHAVPLSSLSLTYNAPFSVFAISHLPCLRRTNQPITMSLDTASEKPASMDASEYMTLVVGMKKSEWPLPASAVDQPK
jgi:hypothetical protein